MWPENKILVDIVAGEDRCIKCGKSAEVFHSDGNHCAECWEIHTTPQTTAPNIKVK